MRDNPAVFALTILGTVVGLAILLYGTFIGADALVPAGGVVVLVAIAGLTYAVFALEGGEESGH